MNKLVKQVGVLDLQSSATRQRQPEYGLTSAEEEFFRSAMKRHEAKMWRHGWPDFLIQTKALGYVGVEVKCGKDPIRANQAAMFEALEAAGLRIFVWHSNAQDRLTPWRKFITERTAEKLHRERTRREKRRLWDEAQLRGKKRER